jgi:pimeloyl-ACP methyl ester carboxylesterase
MNNPVVILHGWGLSSKVFTPLITELQKKHILVYAPDLPGFGDSVSPDISLHLADYVEFLNKYCKKNNIKNPVIIGHSFGGRVALRFLERYPDSVHALVLTGTPGFTPVPKKHLVLFIAIAKIGKLFFFIPLFHFFQDRARRWYYYLVGARDYYRAKGVMRDTFKNIVREELVTSMRDVRIPTLLVWGERDIITPLWIAKKMKTIIHNSKLVVIPNAGHGVSYKNPKEFVSSIYDFLLSLA